jgi:hypothetical protein
MPTQVQFRRGNPSQNNNFKGAAGEISVNTLTNSLRVHNGITTGGFELARADLSNVTASVGSSEWVKTASGIHTFSNVGVGTITPNANLHVVGTGVTALLVDGNARITGILTIGTSSITLDGSGNNIVIGSGVTVYGSVGIISATAIYAGGVNLAASSGYASTAGIATNLSATSSVNTTGIITALRFSGDGSTLTNVPPWGITGAGIHTLSNVGVGTTNPTYKLHVVGSFGATTKSFIIDHPTKQGKKLQHGSLEGPELAVYIRGRSKENTIYLPEYWSNLIDNETITVNLTAIGNSPVPRVLSISDDTIEVFSDEEGDLDYFYMVLAERKDVDKLVVEI